MLHFKSWNDFRDYGIDYLTVQPTPAPDEWAHRVEIPARSRNHYGSDWRLLWVL